MSYIAIARNKRGPRSISVGTIDQVVAIVTDCLDAGESIDRVLSSEGSILRYADFERVGLTKIARRMGLSATR